MGHVWAMLRIVSAGSWAEGVASAGGERTVSEFGLADSESRRRSRPCSTAPDGTCTSVAVYFEPVTPVPLLEMYTRGCTLHTGRCHARALIPEVLALIDAGRLDPALVTSAVVGFDEAEAALVDLLTKPILVQTPGLRSLQSPCQQSYMFPVARFQSPGHVRFKFPSDDL